MQVPQAGSNSSNRVGVEEDFIHFKPSPNFKKMKKFFKLKLDYEENVMKNITNIAPDLQPPPPPPPPPPLPPLPYPEKNEIKKEVQPPLPLDPPPYDHIVINKQVKTAMDVDHLGSSDKTSNMLSDVSLTESKAKQTPKKTVCRDFIRGTCKRTGCKYAHRNDVSHEELYGVYIFCRDYQSKVCVRANCTYVHASVFEEQEYYRSRYLPPHAFAHINKSNVLPPPPPPPPLHTGHGTSRMNEKGPVVNFTIPPPPLHNELERRVHPMISCIQSSAMKAPPPPVPMAPLASMVSLPPMGSFASTSTLKRDWNFEQFTSPGYNFYATETVTNKCNNCDTMEFRYQYNKEKVEKMRQSKEEINNKIALLDKKNEKLNKCIQALLEGGKAS